jgi:hypothetical protein
VAIDASECTIIDRTRRGVRATPPIAFMAAPRAIPIARTNPREAVVPHFVLANMYAWVVVR